MDKVMREDLAAAANAAGGPQTEGPAAPLPDLDGALQVAVEVARSATAGTATGCVSI